MELSDAELITAVRAGDLEAYGTLFERHSQAAHRLARQLVRSTDSDDLVAESFTRVLATLQNGKGPDESFRAYLLTAMRRMHVDRVKARSGSEPPTTSPSSTARRVGRPVRDALRADRCGRGLRRLPERWQMVLWHLDVEGQKPGDIAPLLGMSANSVSALAYRAREGLRQAYLQGHLSPDQSAECRATTSMLGAHVRGGLSSRDTAKVEAHLDTCARCMGLSLELDEVNQHLSGLLGPALLGAAASGYLAAGTGVLAGVGGAVAAAKSLVAGGAEAVLAPFKSAGASRWRPAPRAPSSRRSRWPPSPPERSQRPGGSLARPACGGRDDHLDAAVAHRCAAHSRRSGADRHHTHAAAPSATPTPAPSLPPADPPCRPPDRRRRCGRDPHRAPTTLLTSDRTAHRLRRRAGHRQERVG